MESWHKSVVDGYARDWNLVEDAQHGCRRWWDVPLQDAYFRHNLVNHLGGAGLLDEMATLVTRPFWITERIKKDSFFFFAKDITFAIAEFKKSKNAATREGIKAEELTIIKNALCLSHSFIVEDDAEIWFQLCSRLREATKRYKSIESYVKYLVQNSPQPVLSMEDSGMLQAGTSIDMLSIYDSTVLCISLSNDGKSMLSGCENGLLSRGSVQEVFDTSTQWTAHQSCVTCVALSEDAKFGASGAGDGSLLVIETKKNNHIMEIENAHSSTVNAIAFCKSNSNLVFSCGKDGSICCWDVKRGENVMKARDAHHGKNITAIRETADGLLVSGGEDGKIRFWDSKNISEKNEARIDCESAVVKLVTSLNGQVLAAGFENGTVKAWRINKGTLGSACFDLHDTFVSALFLSSDGELLSVGTKSGCWSCYNVRTKECIGRVRRNHGSVTSISLICVGNDTMCVWATEKGGIRVCEITRQERETHNGKAKALCLSFDGNELAVAHEDGVIAFIDLRTREVRKSVSTQRRLNVVKTIEGGNRVAYGCEHGVVGVWDVLNDKLIREWKVHEGVVLSIALSEDGTHIGSSGKDGMVRVWRLAYPDCCPLLIATSQLNPLHGLYFGEESTSDMVTVSNREATLWKNYQVVKTMKLDELMHCAGRLESFQELGRELFIREKTLATFRNRLYVLDIEGNMSRVGSFETDISSSCWAFSTPRNTLCFVGHDGVVRFATLLEGKQQKD
ncbi:Anaphase-promoting complex subunit 4 [Gracilaria domingensis]|nr:Anaphase-promoting complex subunit 4 [Gracilaria domingensis]